MAGYIAIAAMPPVAHSPPCWAALSLLLTGPPQLQMMLLLPAAAAATAEQQQLGRFSCPGVEPASPFPADDFVVFQYGLNNGTFCCDQTPCTAPSPQGHGQSSFLFAGPLDAASCAVKCLGAYDPDRCRFIVTAGGPAGDQYCMNAQYCNTTNHFGGSNVTIWRRTLPARPPAPVPVPSKAPPAAFFVIDPMDKRELMQNVSRPVYSGFSGAGMHGAGIPTDEHIAYATQHFPFFDCDDAELETAYYFRMYAPIY